MDIKGLIAVRQQQGERLSELIEQTAAAFQSLDATTQNLHSALYRSAKKGINSVCVQTVPGMDDLRRRVKLLIDFKFFGQPDGATIDLIKIITDENNRAVSLAEGDK